MSRFCQGSWPGLFLARPVVAFVVIATPTAVSAAEPEPVPPTFVGSPTFEAPRGALVVPYTGRAPAFRLQRLSASRFELELSPARLTAGTARIEVALGSAGRVAMVGQATPAVVRFQLDLTPEANPTVRVEEASRRITILPRGMERRIGRPAEVTFQTPRPFGAASPGRRPQPLTTPAPLVPARRLPEVPVPQATATPRRVATVFTRVANGPHGQGVALTFSGAVPAFTTRGLGGASLRLTFPGARGPGKPGGWQPGTGSLVRAWRVTDDAPGGACHLDLALRAAGEVVVVHDAARKQLLALPRRRPAPSARAAAAGVAPATTFRPATFDRPTSTLVLPYDGPAPAFATFRTGQEVAIDFLGVALEPPGAQFEAVGRHPRLASWLLAATDGGPLVRLTLGLAAPCPVAVHDDPRHRRLLIALARPPGAARRPAGRPPAAR